MLKINLTDKRGEGTPEEQPQTTPSTGDTAVQASPAAAPGPIKKSRRKPPIALIVALVVVLVAALGYWQRGLFLKLVSPEPEPVAEYTPPPVPAEPEPAPVIDEAEPDPTFTLLNTISAAIPPRIWLTNVVLRHDGSYEVKGMAFAHESMTGFDTSLAGLGMVTDRYFPRKLESSEAVYPFSVSGMVADFTAPDILDEIPAEQLLALAEPVLADDAIEGVRFTRQPEAGMTYAEQDMPFVLQGPFAGLQQVIFMLMDANPDLRVYKLVITPATAGRPYDMVKASFSLRMQSAI